MSSNDNPSPPASIPCWITGLSLGPPLILTGWQQLLFLDLGFTLDGDRGLILFAAAWLLYSIDRQLDASRIRPAARADNPGDTPTARHAFHARHRKSFAGVIAAVTMGLVLYALLHLDRREQVLSCSLAGLALGYALFAQRARRWSRYQTMKPALAAIVLTLGVAVYPLAALQNVTLSWDASVALIAPALLPLYLAFSGNLILIRAGEQQGNAARADRKMAPFQQARNAGQFNLGLAALASLVLGLRFFNSPFNLALAAAAALSLIVARWSFRRHRLGDEARRLWIDLPFYLAWPVLFWLSSK